MSPTRKVVRTVASLFVFAFVGACTFVVGTAPYTEGCASDKKTCENPNVPGQKLCVQKNDWQFGCGKDSCVPCTSTHAATYSCKPSDGSCVVGSCVNGYGDCNRDFTDGCEVLFSSDLHHCGRCETDCTAQGSKPQVTAVKCGGSNCVVGTCQAGFFDCNNNLSDGCEIGSGTFTDTYCGSCTNKCAAGMKCNATTGVCGPA